MLILTRNIGETIRIGDDIEISVADVRGSTVRLSIKAPREVRILREEIFQRVTEAETLAAQVAANAATALAAATHTPHAVTPDVTPDDSTDTGTNSAPDTAGAGN